MNQVVSIGYGKENFSQLSVSLMSFVVTAPWVRTLAGRAFQKQGSTQAYPASAHPDINGMLYQDTIEMPEGTLLLIQASHRYRGASTRDGAFFFQLRANGPMTIVKADLPADRDALNTGKFLMLQGRGDILTCAEAEEAHGLVLPRNFENQFFDEEEVNESFTFSITEQGTPRPKTEKVELADGTVASVAVTRGRRRMRVR